MVSSTLWPHFTPRKDLVPILQESGWGPGPVWTGGISRPHRDSIPDRPARSSVAIPTELPGPHVYLYILSELTLNNFSFYRIDINLFTMSKKISIYRRRG